MTVLIKILAVILIFKTAQTLDPTTKSDVFNKILQLLTNAKATRREINTKPSQKPKDTLRILTFDANEHRTPSEDKLAEAELKYSLLYKPSALLDRPKIETQGKHDYLVLNPMFQDKYVTVIPDNIFMKIEKKCANWLDDCSIKGIRARLLRGVRA